MIERLVDKFVVRNMNIFQVGKQCSMYIMVYQ